jgi:hypothetical protein
MKVSTVEEQGNVQPQSPPQKPKPPQKASPQRKPTLRPPRLGRHASPVLSKGAPSRAEKPVTPALVARPPRSWAW